MTLPVILLLTFYFATLAWVIAYGPQALAVIELSKINASPNLMHRQASFVFGLIPGVNVAFFILIVWVLVQTERLSRDYEGVEEDRRRFEEYLKSLDKNNGPPDEPPTGGAV